MSTVHFPLRESRATPQTESNYFALGGKVTTVFARTSELQRIVKLVSAGTSVEIVGTRWSGRTELLRQVHRTLTTVGVPIVTVRGISGSLPLEAIRSAIPATSPAARSESASPSGLIHRLATQLEEGPSVVLVDDGNLLDEQSWVALETVHKRTGIPIVAVSLRSITVSPADHRLIKFAHPVVKITLGELKLETLHDLLEARLGSAISPSASARIHTKSSGIPGFALAIADGAVSSGLLKQQGDVWQASEHLWSEDLIGAFEALLYTYDAETREAVETLTIVGAVPVATAAKLIGQQRLEILEGHSLVKLFAIRDHHMVAVSPPGIADYFSRLPLSTHRLRMMEQVKKVIGVDGQTQLASVLSDPGDTIPIDAVQLPLVGRMLSESHKLGLATAWRNWERSHSVTDAMRVLHLELTGECSDERLSSVVANVDLRGVPATVELEFRYLHSRLLVLHERDEEEVVEALTSTTPDYPHAVALSAVLLATQMETSGIQPHIERRLRELCETEGVDGSLSRAVLAAALALSSRAHEAFEFIDEIADPFVARLVDVVRGLALFGSGRFIEALEWSAEQVNTAIASGDRTALACHTYVATISSGVLGRYDEASAWGDVALITNVRSAPMLFSPDRALMHALAIIATRAARPMAAQGFIERAELFTGRSEALPFGSLEAVEASAMQADGDARGASKRYRRLAVRLRDAGYELAADTTTMLAVNSGLDEVESQAFRKRAGQIGGALYIAYLDARSAIRHKDPDALVRAAHELHDQQATDEALRHLTHAAKLFRDSGDQQRSTELRAEIQSIISGDPSTSRAATDHVESNWGFTRREQEIVTDIAGGESNLDIARKYAISIRTVETHIRNIRRKTGVLDRGDIGLFSPAN
ncbi:helix-turn-helix transcriptional regulator [Leifsonia poae]|uniref:helix-turn-helix transcriptional regulator n=1 Tax=Leifsonia poae TaxID=110933 RepID=UPI001CC106C2|nr:LuxR C-terminal-related transcriptional regulator [Leifsonia poae]